MEIKQHISTLLEHLQEGLYEREEVMKLTLLSAIAGESIFLLGPPGVGKSLIARRLKYAFSDGKSFEYLMSKFSTPDEVFGPISIQKLKEEDKYERKIEAYLPNAHVVFLDEIWKSSSSIQNALLTILNEKVYRNGEHEISVDIRGIITASNELPPNEASFGPLYDRLLIRYNLDNIEDESQFLAMITDANNVYDFSVPEHIQISTQTLAQWDEKIRAVSINDEVLSTIQLVRKKIEAHNASLSSENSPITPHDRRWKKVVRLLRTSAFLNGRNSVNLMDCFLMTHCLWNHPDQLPVIRELVAETIRKHGYSLVIKLNSVKKEIAAFEREVAEETTVNHTVTENVLKPFDQSFYKLQKNGSPFKGQYVRVNDFNKLNTEPSAVLNIYDEEQKLVNRLEASPSSKEHHITMKHNSTVHEFELETYQQEKTQKISRAPHPMVKAYWDERFEKLNNYLNEQLQRLETEHPEQLNDIEKHLFIDKRLAPIITENLRDVTQSLKTIQLQLEHIKHRYDNAPH